MNVGEGNELNGSFEEKHEEIPSKSSDELIHGFDESVFCVD